MHVEEIVEAGRGVGAEDQLFEDPDTVGAVVAPYPAQRLDVLEGRVGFVDLLGHVLLAGYRQRALVDTVRTRWVGVADPSHGERKDGLEVQPSRPAGKLEVKGEGGGVTGARLVRAVVAGRP